jgi:hypothetical protein
MAVPASRLPLSGRKFARLLVEDLAGNPSEGNPFVEF